jgi:hypothetical protein
LYEEVKGDEMVLDKRSRSQIRTFVATNAIGSSNFDAKNNPL